MCKDPVFRTDESVKVEEASLKARQTFKFFWRELSWEYRRIVPGLDLAGVKVRFKIEDPGRNEPQWEYLWLGAIEFDGMNIKGQLLNDPKWIRSYVSGDYVEVHFGKMSDWMYALEGKVYGGYTVNLMRSQMSKQERLNHDKAWGLTFSDAKIIKIVPRDTTPTRRVTIFSKLFPLRESSLTIQQLERTEHPMSVNMEQKIREGLSTNPSRINSTDSEGWTMLHREALAGNLIPVRILAEMGADLSLKIAAGRTALDLAKLMGWPLIVDFLDY